MSLITLVPRWSWGMPGDVGPAKVTLPSRGMWLHHSFATVTDDGDADVHDDVFGDARRIARVGIERFGRASYSFFRSPAGPRGQVLEMQGDWIGAHTAKQNSTSHAFVLHGNFQKLEPTDDDLWTIAATAAWGAREGKWAEPVLLGGHRDSPYSSTLCPGSNLYDAIPDLNRLARQLYKEGIMATLDQDDLDAVADAVAAKLSADAFLEKLEAVVTRGTWGPTVGRQPYTYGQAVGRVYRWVEELAGRVSSEGSAVTAEELAAAILDEVLARSTR